MKALDMERLKAKVESGGADEEKVLAMVKKLGEQAKRAPRTAKRLGADASRLPSAKLHGALHGAKRRSAFFWAFRAFGAYPPPPPPALHVTTSAPAIRMLAEERKGLVVVELEKQLEYKRIVRAEEEAVEREIYSKLLTNQREGHAKDAARAAALAEKRSQTTAMLHEQLAENNHRRIIAEEAKLLEGELMVKAALRDATRLAAVTEAKRAAARASAAETMVANEAFSARDATRRVEEARWERELLEQQATKDRLLRATEAAAKVEKEAAEERFNKMRAAQKKVTDNRGAEDQVRAVRANEVVELAARARARDEAERKEERLRDVAAGLTLQLQVKRVKEEEDRLRDRAEAADARAHGKMLAAREEHVHVAARARAVKAKHDLEVQKRESDVARAQEFRRPLEERAATKLAEEAQRRVVENFRADIVPRMEKEGVGRTFLHTAKNISNMLL